MYIYTVYINKTKKCKKSIDLEDFSELNVNFNFESNISTVTLTAS